jgi:hypothetical protein
MLHRSIGIAQNIVQFANWRKVRSLRICDV